MTSTIYTYRFIARVTIEAETPLTVGNGEKDIMTDALVAKDCNGLPYIPGTSLAGVVRHSLYDNGIACETFGSKGHGSQLIFSDALIIDETGTAVDGMQDISNSAFLRHFSNLPIRQHVRINDKGAATKHGKFDEQIVFKGTRFVFEIEQLAVQDNDSTITSILSHLKSPSFRIGGGTRCGFGEIKVIDVKYRKLNLAERQDLDLYISKSSSLSCKWEGFESKTIETECTDNWHEFELELKPTDFFIFSSGLGDDDVDNTPVIESYICWDGGTPVFKEQQNLIPATSVKGAIAHRTIYHLNKLTGNFADTTTNAISELPELFGSDDDNTPARGNILLSDVFMKNTETKIFNHVTIDRISGGAYGGHLFSEKVVIGNNECINLKITVNKKAFENPNIKKAFTNTLHDICNGLLPLGGATNKGYGIFTGKIIKGE